MKRLSGLVKTVTKMVTGCLRAIKVVMWLKSSLVTYEVYGTLSLHVTEFWPHFTLKTYKILKMEPHKKVKHRKSGNTQGIYRFPMFV